LTSKSLDDKSIRGRSGAFAFLGASAGSSTARSRRAGGASRSPSVTLGVKGEWQKKPGGPISTPYIWGFDKVAGIFDANHFVTSHFYPSS